MKLFFTVLAVVLVTGCLSSTRMTGPGFNYEQSGMFAATPLEAAQAECVRIQSARPDSHPERCLGGYGWGYGGYYGSYGYGGTGMNPNYYYAPYGYGVSPASTPALEREHVEEEGR